MEFDVGDNNSGKYKIEAIRHSAVYARESKSGYLPGLYYLVSWKGYSEEENTWEPASAVQHLKKLISLFHKGHPDKPTATSPAIDSTLLIVRPTVKPTKPLKQKKGWPANSTNKQAKKNWTAFDFYRIFGWIWVTSMFDILSRTACDCTWHPADLYQNFYLSTFKSHTWLDFLDLLSLSHKASVFLLKFLLGQEVFSLITFH